MWAKIVLALLLFLCGSKANMNFLVPSYETERLLGVSRELSYVRDGVVNDGALGFDIPVASDVESVHFEWSNLDPALPINYNLVIQAQDDESDNRSEAMHQPHLNISHRGHVPRYPTTWRVSLPCGGVVSATVRVLIDLTWSHSSDLSSDATTVRLSRTKKCESSDSKASANNDNLSRFWSVEPHVVFMYAVLTGLSAILLTSLAVFIVHKRSSAAKRNKSSPAIMTPNDHYEPIHQAEEQEPFNLIQTRPHAQPQFRSAPFHAGPIDAGMTSDAESRVTDWIQQQQHHHQTKSENEPSAEEKINSLQVDRSSLKLGCLLQEGTFGKVYQGTLEDPDRAEDQDVMIKTVMTYCSANQSELLVLEGVRLFGLTHRHILTPLAATWDGSSPMIIYPYASQGNLKQYLAKFATAGLSTHQIVIYGVQLLSALGHMHRRKVIHKDIAARNCFMGDGHVLKIGDSSLSRDLFPSDYHCLGDNDNRPIKWMPMETITLRKYSEASDVWSFGVFMWELMTKAQQPFSEIDPFEMEDYLTGGYRLHQPLNCPDQLYSILVSCWGTQPQERSSVQQLYSTLQSLHRQLQQFV